MPPGPQIYGRPMQTAVAPSASALNMSVPRRNPPSTRTGIFPLTASTTSRRALDGAPAAVFSPSTMVRHDDAVHASCNASFASSAVTIPLRRIFIVVKPRSLSTESQFQSSGLTRVACDTSRPLKIGRVKTGPMAHHRVTRLTGTRVLSRETCQRLSIIGQVIDRQHQHRASGSLHPSDDRAGDSPLIRSVELKPHRLAPRLVDRLDRCGRHRREELEMLARPGRSRRGQLAVGMERTLAADRREDDRRLVLHTKDRDRHVDRGDADQSPHAQLVAIERFSVRPDGRIVIRSRSSDSRNVPAATCAARPLRSRRR